MPLYKETKIRMTGKSTKCINKHENFKLHLFRLLEPLIPLGTAYSAYWTKEGKKDINFEKYVVSRIFRF